MKKLSGLKDIEINLNKSMNEIFADLLVKIKETKQEYKQNIIDEKIKLLVEICNGEGLNLNEMKMKYLRTNELGNLDLNDTIQGSFLVDDNLLDKIKINDEDYYYEPVNNGTVYNINNQPVGLFKNGVVIFNKC